MPWKKLRQCFSATTTDRLHKATMEDLLCTLERRFIWNACGCDDSEHQSGMSAMNTCEFTKCAVEPSNNFVYDQRNEGIH